MHRIPTEGAPRRLLAVDAWAAAVHRKVTACRQRPGEQPVPGLAFGDGVTPCVDSLDLIHRGSTCPQWA